MKQDADLSSLAYFLVYVRNSHDSATVIDSLRQYLPEGLPFAVLRASVCRPEWLVEAEGVAIIPDKAPFEPFV
jgi:hypothetical protein